MSTTDCTAKVPDDERNWTAIDIFLFSNGQMQTPPRKYHLTVEELYWWDGVLNYLASSQFGSSASTIELYTIDGHKVNGPLDLCDGMPYVAVLPPATFVDSGYGKYLLKASRSWEKRQAKRSTECKTDDLKADCPDACCPCPKSVDGEGNDDNIVSALSQINEINTKPKLPQSDQELTAIKASDEIVPIESWQTSGNRRPWLSSHQQCEENCERKGKRKEKGRAMGKALTRPQRSSTPKCEEDLSQDQPPSKIKNGSAPQRPSIIRNYRKRSSGQHPSFAKSAGPQTGMNKVPSSMSNAKETNQKKIVNNAPVKANERNTLKTPQNQFKKGKVPLNQFKKPPVRGSAKASGLKQATTTVTPDVPKFLQEMPLTAQNSPAYSPNIPKCINSRQQLNNKLIRTPLIQDLITDKEITREYSTTIHENTNNKAACPDMDKTQILHSVTVDEMVSCHIENNGIDQSAQTDKEVLTNVISVSFQEVARLENEQQTNVISVPSKEVDQTASEETKNDISFPHEEIPQMNDEVSTDLIFIPDPQIARTNKDTNVITIPGEEVAQMDNVESTNIIDNSPPPQEVVQTDKEVFNSKSKALSGVSSHANNVNSKVRLSDNYVAVVNKGDGINVNLNIEVQKGKTNTNLQDQESTVLEIRKLSSLSDIFRRSKLQNLNEESVAVETKSLQSIISPTNNFTKVVVVQCGCCGTHTTIPQFNTVPVFKDENGFFILMPGPTPAVTQSCGCGPNNENEQNPATVVNKLSESCIKDLSMTKSENIYPCEAQDVGVVMTVMHCGIRSRINDCHDNELDSITLAQRVCIEDHYNGGCNSNILSQQIGKTELPEESRGNCTSKNKSNTEDSYVQTEWCCMLMQVRQHDDHHYSFHLPPLELVKHYSR